MEPKVLRENSFLSLLKEHGKISLVKSTTCGVVVVVVVLFFWCVWLVFVVRFGCFWGGQKVFELTELKALLLPKQR